MAYNISREFNIYDEDDNNKDSVQILAVADGSVVITVLDSNGNALESACLAVDMVAPVYQALSQIQK